MTQLRGLGAEALPLETSRTSARIGWVDLLASDALGFSRADLVIEPVAARSRQLRTGLRRLHGEGLVGLPDQPRRYRQFVLLDEDPAHGGVLYRPPSSSEDTTSLPIGLLTHGWLHALEDSELQLLLMVATAGGGVLDPATRARAYAMTPTSYQLALQVLTATGIVAAAGTVRRPTLTLDRDLLDRPAWAHVTETLDRLATHS